MASPRNLSFGPLLGLAMAAWSPASAADWQGLVEKSPFGQPAANANANGPAQELEFRGLVEDDGVLLVNLYDPAKRASRWVEVNGQEPGLQVKSYDAAANTVQVVKDGRPITLALKQARVVLAAAPPPPAPAEPPRADGAELPPDAAARDPRRTAASNAGAAGPNAAAVRNLPPEAQAIIQEIRRRRAERAGNRPVVAQPPAPSGN